MKCRLLFVNGLSLGTRYFRPMAAGYSSCKFSLAFLNQAVGGPLSVPLVHLHGHGFNVAPLVKSELARSMSIGRGLQGAQAHCNSSVYDHCPGLLK